ncbi:MAG: hypothetical protein J5858_09540, partial [Lentisphaeria bacterium]|nr:hypothetical protein [Lentisphaeria bacterium]
LHLPCMLPGLNVEGLENGRSLLFDAGSGQTLHAYAGAAEELRGHTQEICRRAQVDMIDAMSDEDLVKPLLRFFRNRRSKR